MDQVEGTEAQMRRLAAAVDKARALPRRDTLRGATGRVRISPTVPGPGWTLRHADIVQHPTDRNRYAYPVTADVQALHGTTVRDVNGQGDVTIDTSSKVERGSDWEGGTVMRVIATRGR